MYAVTGQVSEFICCFSSSNPFKEMLNYINIEIVFYIFNIILTIHNCNNNCFKIHFNKLLD